MDNGIDWVARFGKPPENWDDGEFRMVVFSMLNQQHGQLKIQSSEITQIKSTMKLLPCAQHSNDIQSLKDCTQGLLVETNDQATEQIRGTMAVRVERVKGWWLAVAAAIGGVCGALSSWFRQ